MSRIRVLAALLLAGLFAVLIPLSVVLAVHPSAGGTAVLMDSDDTEYSNMLSDKLSASITGLPPLAPNMAYEGWLVSDDGSRTDSTGIIMPDANGNAMVSYMAMEGDEATGENLFSAFDRFVITVEPAPDDDPAPSMETAAIYQIPMTSIANIRELTYSAEGNPAYGSGNFHEGMAKGTSVGLREQTSVAGAHAGLAFNAADVAGVHQHACHVVNIIEGSAGDNYDASCGDPGDGFGVLNYSANAVTTAGLAATASPEDGIIVSNGQKVISASTEASTLASQAHDQAMKAKMSTDATVAKIHMGNASDLLSMALSKSSDAYMASQAMGTFTVVEAPATGDFGVPKLAILSLLIGAALLASGTLVFRHTRPTTV